MPTENPQKRHIFAPDFKFFPSLPEINEMFSRGRVLTKGYVKTRRAGGELPRRIYSLINMRIDLQLIAAFILSTGGLILLFCGVFIDPQGEIHSSLLVAFGETATFAGALFGIDYVYKKKK